MCKSRSWNWRHALALLALVALLAWTVPISARPACRNYNNSRMVINMDIGAVYCGNTGGTCEECFNIGGGGTAVTTCWSDGWSVICQDPDGSIYVY